MLSKALSHFPQFRFREGEKRLWNPILKKTFVTRPEEQVRLALIDYLTLETEFSAHRISFESPVKLVGDKSQSRTDIICYDQDFKSLLLVECKAPEIKLDEKAAIQVARYNQKVGAPYILVSNGVLDFWFEIIEGKIRPKVEVPPPFQPNENKTLTRDYSYWQERGFVGGELAPRFRNFATSACKELFTDAYQPIKYLGFEAYPPEFALGHYYRIFGFRKDLKVAISVASNSFGGTRLNAILNEESINTAFCTVSLDLIANEAATNAEIHSAQGTREIDVRAAFAFKSKQTIADLLPEITSLLVKHA